MPNRGLKIRVSLVRFRPWAPSPSLQDGRSRPIESAYPSYRMIEWARRGHSAQTYGVITLSPVEALLASLLNQRRGTAVQIVGHGSAFKEDPKKVQDGANDALRRAPGRESSS